LHALPRHVETVAHLGDLDRVKAQRGCLTEQPLDDGDRKASA
jgi:hypothetical protein